MPNRKTIDISAKFAVVSMAFLMQNLECRMQNYLVIFLIELVAKV